MVLTKLFPLGKPLGSEPTDCKTYSAEDIANTMPRFQTGCKVEKIECTTKQIQIAGKSPITEYRLESTATCGSNDVATTRTQEVEGKGLE